MRRYIGYRHQSLTRRVDCNENTHNATAFRRESHECVTLVAYPVRTTELLGFTAFNPIYLAQSSASKNRFFVGGALRTSLSTIYALGKRIFVYEQRSEESQALLGFTRSFAFAQDDSPGTCRVRTQGKLRNVRVPMKYVCLIVYLLLGVFPLLPSSPLAAPPEEAATDTKEESTAGPAPGAAPPSPQDEEAEDTTAEEEPMVRKVVWDINIRTTPQDLLIQLRAIRETYNDLVLREIEPDMVFLFRGGSVQWLAQQRRQRSGYSPQVIQEIIALLADFQKRPGVRMEADLVARELIQDEAKDLLPGIKPIQNGYVALIEYQAQGYGTISLY